MNIDLSRRDLLRAAGVLAVAQVSLLSQPKKGSAMDGSVLPRLCLGIGSRADVAQMRKFKQIGIEHVLMGGPPIPWKEAELRKRMDRFLDGGLDIINLMIGGFPKTIYGRPGRDQEIENVCESIRAAGNVGLPVIEYNFYAHRAIAALGTRLERPVVTELAPAGAFFEAEAKHQDYYASNPDAPYCRAVIAPKLKKLK